MLIDIEVACCTQPQIERPVPRGQLQHVIQEPDAGFDVVPPVPVECQAQGDRRLRRLALDYTSPHRTSSSAATRARVSSTTPAVIRTHPLQPASAERSRTNTPRAASASAIRPASLKRARTKLASLFQWPTVSR